MVMSQVGTFSLWFRPNICPLTPSADILWQTAMSKPRHISHNLWSAVIGVNHTKAAFSDDESKYFFRMSWSAIHCKFWCCHRFCSLASFLTRKLLTKTAGEEVQKGDWQDAIGGAKRKEKRPLAADLSWLPEAAAAAAAAAGEAAKADTVAAFTPLPSAAKELNSEQPSPLHQTINL